jgi:hypothetical protein
MNQSQTCSTRFTVFMLRNEPITNLFNKIYSLYVEKWTNLKPVQQDLQSLCWEMNQSQTCSTRFTVFMLRNEPITNLFNKIYSLYVEKWTNHKPVLQYLLSLCWEMNQSQTCSTIFTVFMLRNKPITYLFYNIYCLFLLRNEPITNLFYNITVCTLRNEPITNLFYNIYCLYSFLNFEKWTNHKPVLQFLLSLYFSE